MIMIKHTLALALTLTAVTLPTVASAATTVDTVRTGIGTPGGTDANWTVNNGLPTYISKDKPGSWGPVAGTTNLVSGYGSAYIVPAVDSNGNAVLVNNNSTAPTNYIYQTVFTMPGIANLSTALLSGRFWADNRLASIFLNGTQIYSNLNTNPNQQQFLNNGTAFGAATGFQYGDNLLTFNLVDGTGSGNWTGLNVAADVTAAVPEPGTWMLMLLGFGAIGFAMRSRAKTQVRFQFA
jgi:PEP-CTERM motif